MNVIQQALVPTIVLGLTYALVATGFVVLFKSIGILSFAQGAFMIVGALVFYALLANGGLEWVLALVLTLVVVAAAGAICYKVAYSPKLGGDPLIIAFSTVGLGILLEQVIYMVWGTQAQSIPPVLHFSTWHITSQIVIGPTQVVVIIVSLVVMAAVGLLVRYTPIGMRMRATADSSTLASYYGIRVDGLSAFTWALAALCAGCGGIVYSMVNAIDPVTLPNIGLATFPAIILGGIDSLAGAVVGGLVVAFLGTALATAFGSQYQDLASYTLLLVVLLIRPRGLFGSPDVSRV